MNKNVKRNVSDKISNYIQIMKGYSCLFSQILYSPVDWGSRIHRLHLCRGARPPHECPIYDIKQSVGEAPIMLVL